MKIKGTPKSQFDGRSIRPIARKIIEKTKAMPLRNPELLYIGRASCSVLAPVFGSISFLTPRFTRRAVGYYKP
jgi:hypothetical protein